jgi:hypothetical protein
MYAIPSNPMVPKMMAMGVTVFQGARTTADRKSTVLKCTIVGVPNAAPASRPGRLPVLATSDMKMNCNPIKAAAADPIVT